MNLKNYFVFCIDNGLCPMIAHVHVSDSVPLLDSEFKLVTQISGAALLACVLDFNWKTTDG